MAELELCIMLIPEKCGGLGFDSVRYAIAIEELSRGWMSPARVINSHLMPTYMAWKFGTSPQPRFRPWLAQGTCRSHLGLTTEANAGSDASSMRSAAKRNGDEDILNGPMLGNERTSSPSWRKSIR
jgi:alkylation response protein AidB-like acyl-CoA dehydrogenase